MSRVYKFDGEEFEISEPKDCEIQVFKNEQTASISVDKRLNRYVVEFNNVKVGQDSLKLALKLACSQILKFTESSVEERRDEIHDFYDSLSDA